MMKGIANKKIVISGVNLTEAGFLSVLKDCLNSFKKIVEAENLDITVLVHKKELVKEHIDQFNIIEYPAVKPSWLKRLWFEYVESKAISKKLNPDLWISLHDITPNVTCKQVVYCHNPTPFYKVNGSELFTDYKLFLMCLFYKYLYAINIKKNQYVIVQQEWLRRAFEKNHGVKTIVAHPINIALEATETIITPQESKLFRSKYLFIYPAFPRPAKNFEVLLNAALLLQRKRDDFEVLITTDGTESIYAKKIFDLFGQYDFIKFVGRKSRAEIFNLYEEVDCMVFPSKLETWGLPITEFKTFDKPMLIADMAYAHETLGKFDKAKFFRVDNVQGLANDMRLLIERNLIFDKNEDVQHFVPFCQNWDELTQFLTTQI